MQSILNDFDSDQLKNRSLEMMIEQNVYNTVSALKAVTVKEGNKWMTLMGENIQEGICGFGDTPFLSMDDFYNQLHIIPSKKADVYDLQEQDLKNIKEKGYSNNL